MKRVAAMPGVGLLLATAAVATMGEPKAFKSGREFCAWLGLVPKQRGTGGQVSLLGISKRGDTYLRTLLVQGARVVLRHAKDPDPWLEQLCTAGLVARSVEQRKNLLERRPSPTGLPGLSVTAP